MTPTPTTLIGYLDKTATFLPRRKALFFGGEVVRYGELHMRALGLARMLRDDYGIQPGDRVALLMKNCPEFIYALYGILFTGGTVVPVNNFLKPAEIEYILRDAGVRVLITQSAEFEPVLAHVRAQLPALRPLDIAAVPWAAVAAKLASLGGQHPGYYVEVARALGYEIAVTEFRPFTVGQAVGQPLQGRDWAFAWRVEAPETTINHFRTGRSAAGEPLRHWGNEKLECAIRPLAPAHTHVIFGYGPREA